MKYITTDKIIYHSPKWRGIEYTWGDLTITNCYVIVNEGFGCDGCTCSPDFDDAITGCITHDALYKALREDPNCPFTRKMADKALLRIMQKDGCKLAWVYYITVRVAGRKHAKYVKKN